MGDLANGGGVPRVLRRVAEDVDGLGVLDEGPGDHCRPVLEFVAIYLGQRFTVEKVEFWQETKITGFNSIYR